MKEKTIINAIDLYYALLAADVALRDFEQNKRTDLSKYRTQIGILMKQLTLVNTSGNIKITIKGV